MCRSSDFQKMIQELKPPTWYCTVARNERSTFDSTLSGGFTAINPLFRDMLIFFSFRVGNIRRDYIPSRFVAFLKCIRLSYPPHLSSSAKISAKFGKNKSSLLKIPAIMQATYLFAVLLASAMALPVDDRLSKGLNRRQVKF